MIPRAGQCWIERKSLPLARRVATVDAVAGDEVIYRLADSTCPSRCPVSEFVRTHVSETTLNSGATS